MHSDILYTQTLTHTVTRPHAHLQTHTHTNTHMQSDTQKHTHSDTHTHTSVLTSSPPPLSAVCGSDSLSLSLLPSIGKTRQGLEQLRGSSGPSHSHLSAHHRRPRPAHRPSPSHPSLLEDPRKTAPPKYLPSAERGHLYWRRVLSQNREQLLMRFN